MSVTFGRVQIHYLCVWDFAYRDARKGYWEQVARDRCRFKRRIGHTELILKPVLEKKLTELQTSTSESDRNGPCCLRA